MSRPPKVQHKLHYGTMFIFCFTVYKTDLDKVKKLLDLNETVYECVPNVFGGFVDFEFKNCNMRKASIIRALLKNITLHQ